MNVTTKKATATRVRKTKNETIRYGDTVVRKSVEIGKYNFLSLFFLDGSDTPYIGASGTRENASKWTPGQISLDIYPTRKTDDDHTRALFSNRMFDAKKKYGAPKQIRRNGCTWYRYDRPYTRTVVKLERS